MVQIRVHPPPFFLVRICSWRCRSLGVLQTTPRRVDAATRVPAPPDVYTVPRDRRVAAPEREREREASLSCWTMESGRLFAVIRLIPKDTDGEREKNQIRISNQGTLKEVLKNHAFTFQMTSVFAPCDQSDFFNAPFSLFLLLLSSLFLTI